MTGHEANGLLQQWTLRAFLQRRPPATVVLLHDDMSLVEVLARFARSNIISAPVFNREELKYLGFLDLLDVVHALLAWFPPHSDPASLATYIEQAGQRLATATVADIALHNDAKLVFQANVNANLLEVVQHGFLMPAAAGRPCHRLAVFDYDPTTADPGDAAAGVHFTNIVSQSDVVSFLHQHAAQLGPTVLGTSLEGLGLRPRSVVAVPSDMPAIHAFRAVRDSGVGCAGVVELHSHGALVASLSTSDLRGMLPHHIQLLQLPVVEFLSRSLGGWEPSPTTLTQSFGVKSPRKHTREVQVATCSMQTTLGEVLERVAAQHLHRLFVVDESGRPLTVLTLTDLLQLMVGQDGMG